MTALSMPDDTLETIADWKDDLSARIRGAELIFEVVDAAHDIQPLVAEVEQFKRCCKAIAWRPVGAETGQKEAA